MTYIKFLQLISFVGVISTASGQTGSPPPGNQNPFDRNDVLYIDPFMAEKCAAKGIKLSDIDTEKESCVTEAQYKYTNRTGTVDIMDTMVVPCRIRAEIDSCVEEYINGMQRCYDTADQKKQVAKAKGVINSLFDYMCQDDGKKLKETFNTFGNMLCLMKVLQVSENCMKAVTEGVDITSMHLQNEETCLISYEVAKCLTEPMKDCDSMAPYEFFSGLMDATMDASECRKYNLPHLYSGATASSYNTGITLITCFAALVFRF